MRPDCDPRSIVGHRSTIRLEVRALSAPSRLPGGDRGEAPRLQSLIDPRQAEVRSRIKLPHCPALLLLLPLVDSGVGAVVSERRSSLISIGMALSGKQRRSLRALAHARAAVVHIGQRGITAPLAAQVDRALTDHELIKVKLTKESPLTVDDAAGRLADAANCEIVGTVGRVLILYRARPEGARIRLPETGTERDR